MESNKPVLGMVLKGYPRISETFISNEIRLLEEEGLEIHIISMRRPREAFTHDSVRQIRAKVTYLPESMLPNLHRLLYHNFLYFLSNPAQYAKTAGFTLRRFADTRKSATIKHFLQAGYLLHKTRNGRALDHLHAHFAHSPTSVAVFAHRLSGIPFSFTGHAKDVYTQRRDRLAAKLGKAAFVVTCTGHNKDYLDALADGAVAVDKVYHGIDLSLFVPGEPRFAPEPPWSILTVARMTGKKGLDDVLRALALLKKRGLAFTYSLIGEGEDRQALTALVKELDIADRVEFLGTQTHATVIERLRGADAFVLGCRVMENGDRDGIPNVLVESMAMGVPVVATTVSAIPELVESGKNGLLAQPGEPDALADALEKSLTDHAYRKAVIPAAMERVRTEFDNRKHIRALADIYRKRAGNPPGIFGNGSAPTKRT